MSMVMPIYDSPKMIWDGLYYRCDYPSDFDIAQIHSGLSRKTYNGKTMVKYTSEWEYAAAHLESIEASLNESM